MQETLVLKFNGSFRPDLPEEREKAQRLGRKEWGRRGGQEGKGRRTITYLP